MLTLIATAELGSGTLLHAAAARNGPSQEVASSACRTKDPPQPFLPYRQLTRRPRDLEHTYAS